MSDSPEVIEARFHEGLALLKAGRLAPAREIFHAILAMQPAHFDALHLSGVIALQSGDPGAAVALISQAISVNPQQPAAHNNLGAALTALGRHLEAAESFARALALNPDYAEAAFNRGNALMSLQRAGDALRSYDQALVLKPGYAEALNGRGNARRALGETDAALSDYTTAIAHKPGEAVFFNNRGTVLTALGRHGEALAAYDQAIALKSDLGDAHYNRGNLLLALKRYTEAVAAYDRAAILKPADAVIRNNRGNTLRKLLRFDDARASYDEAIALDPTYVDAYHNRGAVWGDLDEHDKAIADFDRAIARDPTNADAYNSRGMALRELRRHQEALASHRKALEIDPDHADARWALGVCQLQMGDFVAGWSGYAWRWKAPQVKLDPRNFAAPLWYGDEDLDGKTILLHAEQGLGDTLQFVRYVKAVADKGARVILEVQAPLASLLRNLDGLAAIVAKGDPLPPFDLHCPLLNLPLAFKNTGSTIPGAQGYLQADPSKQAAWAKILGAKTRSRVGLAWSGNPGHRNDARRSVPLNDVIRLLPPNFDYVALQKDVRLGDRAALAEGGIRYFGDELADFADTATLCTLMDVVISVDTSIAHLAGALAVPTWILLPFNPDWRWLLDRNDSPWYEAVTLYRQEAPGNWTGVLNRVAAALKLAHTKT